MLSFVAKKKKKKINLKASSNKGLVLSKRRVALELKSCNQWKLELFVQLKLGIVRIETLISCSMKVHFEFKFDRDMNLVRAYNIQIR